MAQAKRRKPISKPVGTGPSLHGFGVLLAGMVIGSLATILWQGMRSADGGVGTGIRQMIEQSKESDEVEQTVAKVNPDDTPVKQETSFDFYTVLPEIEVVVPANQEQSAPPPKSQSSADDEEKDESSEQVTVQDASSYMLQAGSYKDRKDADRLKAELALSGLSSTIQQVTIQGQGDFYRVRLGPYLTHDAMVKVDESLASRGIKTLRLKVSRGG